MKIKSRFKDYYDYVAHQYGGGDERIVYNREPLTDEQTVVQVETSRRLPVRYEFYTPIRLDVLGCYRKYLAINGRYYMLIATRNEKGLVGPYQLWTEENFGHRLNEVFKPSRYDSKVYKEWALGFGVESEAVVNISRQIKQPVFLIDHFNGAVGTKSVYIDRNIPILEHYGINHHIPPEQMYQEIAYYVSNKMVSSPDLVVHDNMTDQEKILQHGFDFKQSFRHRKTA